MNLVENSAIKEILDERPDLLNHPDEVLAIALMHSINHKECAWSNHAQSMPDTFNSTLFWTDAELQELRECTVFHLTNLMKRQIKSDWETLHGPLAMRYPHLLGAASLNSYTWALSVIYSRAVGIVRNGQYIRCVPPIIDMANHNPRAAHTVEETLAYDDVNDRILLLNTSSKKPGDEIYALYGVYPNSKLLYTYGFVIPGNPHRAIDLWTRVTQSTYDYITKQEILENHELTQEQLYDFTGTLREKWISPSLLATIRVIHANEHEMENIENAFHGGMISTRNEMVSYVSLRNLLLARLKPEKVETDRLKLRELMASQHDADEHPRLLMALITRVEERELIQSCLEMVDSWMATLENKGEDYTPPDYVTNNISGSVEDNDKGEVGLNLDANHVE
mmetsp:Transcript_12481/g.12567  ORF Transcript_12481/g.12567 Transcript_12481/m.12567 type:complete len:394 (+) Transcript_12481:1-1182(+)